MSDDTARTLRLDINGASLHVETTGTGDPIVLVHAGIADARMWDPTVPAFTTDHRVIRYDMRGYGRSTIPPLPFAHHDDLAAIFTALELGPSIVIGASYGGEVAASFAIEHPENVLAVAIRQPGAPTRLLTGDSLFPGGIGKTDDDEQYERLLTDVVERLFRRFPDDTVFHPGHGLPSTIGRERGFLNRWRLIRDLPAQNPANDKYDPALDSAEG